MADKLSPSDGWIDVNKPLIPKTHLKNEETRNNNLWPRSVARKWLMMLFVGACLLYCARMATPICAVSMAANFHWTKTESGLVLGAFYWGYCFTQILGGHVSDRVGGERVLFVSVSLWSLIMAITPLLVQLSSHTVALMTVARILTGLLQGVFFPSVVSLCSQRVLEDERGFLMSIAHSGSFLGALLAGGMGSMMLDELGWPSVFFFSGLLSCAWALLVLLFFLEGEVIPKPGSGSSVVVGGGLLHLHTLCKKPSVWSMVIAHMCTSSSSNTLLSWLPTYFKESYPLAPSWGYNMIPWLAAIPFALSGGYVSKFLLDQKYGVSTVRKIMQFLAMGVSTLFLLLVSGGALTSFSPTVMCVSVSVGLSTFTSCGVSVNVQDLTPSCAGALYGFMNMLGAFMGLVLIWLSGYLIQVTLSWASVFSLVSFVNIIGLIIYLIFGDVQRVDLDTDCCVSVTQTSCRV